MKGIVLDCSVTMAWFLRDHPVEYADRVLCSLDGREAFVPALWQLEVLNVFLSSERKGRITRDQSLKAISQLRSLPIHMETPEESSPPETILRLAGDFGLTAYDAAYLDVALRRRLPMATMDDALENACQSAGVALL